MLQHFGTHSNHPSVTLTTPEVLNCKGGVSISHFKAFLNCFRGMYFFLFHVLAIETIKFKFRNMSTYLFNNLKKHEFKIYVEIANHLISENALRGY